MHWKTARKIPLDTVIPKSMAKAHLWFGNTSSPVPQGIICYLAKTSQRAFEATNDRTKALQDILMF